MEHFEYIIEPPSSRFFDWKELKQYKELFYFFTWRDIKIKYKQTVLGFLWALLQPLLMMTIFTFFFGRALSIPTQGLEYPVFVFSGLLMWNIFSMGLTSATSSMVSNAAIIKKIYFPRIVIPVSSILGALFDSLMAFVLFIALLFYYHQSVQWSTVWWCWPAAVTVSFIATLGPGSLLSALNVKYRDVRYVIPFLVQILLFLSPVIYPVTMLRNPILQYLMVLSPVYAAVELFRSPLTGALPDINLLCISLISGIVFLCWGLIYFRRTEDYFADLA